MTLVKYEQILSLFNQAYIIARIIVFFKCWKMLL